MMKFFERNKIRNPAFPEPGYLAASLFLIGGAFKLGEFLFKNSDELKIKRIYPSFLWLTSLCAICGGGLFFLFAFLSEPKIVVTETYCFSLHHAISFTCLALLFAFLAIILPSIFIGANNSYIIIRNRIDRLDKTPLLAFLLVIRDFVRDILCYIMERYRNKIREIREKRNRPSQ